MKKTGRPVSPHVTIYAFPVGALSSITNRVTGCALSFGAAGLGALEILVGSGTSLELMQTIGSQGFLISGGAKCTLTEDHYRDDSLIHLSVIAWCLTFVHCIARFQSALLFPLFTTTSEPFATRHGITFQAT
jgi:succinate dehydrogenase/fumarate reductase cytochrome b subunit